MRRPATSSCSTVARERARARTGRRSLAVAISLLACFGAPLALTGSAHADTIADKRAQAEAIADEIAENGKRISQLDEDLLEAELRIHELESQISTAEHDIASTRKQARRTGDDLHERATELYVTGGSAAAMLPSVETGDFSEAGARQVYLETTAQRDTEILNDLQASNKLLGEQVDALETAQSQAEAEKRRLDRARADLEAANARQAELLDQTQGELADLIAQEQARQAAAAEAAARAQQDASADDGGDDGSSSSDDGTSNDGGSDNGDDGSDDGSDDGGDDITVVAPNPRAQTAVDAALDQLGTPYSYATPGSWDDPDPSSFDCSGLTGWAWYQAGYSLPHSSRAQFASLPHVGQSDLLPGDLVFYGSPIHHVGMYIGNGQYVHAPQTGDVVKISTIYRDDWAGAARIPG